MMSFLRRPFLQEPEKETGIKILEFSKNIS
jgi:hypothetical protein